MKIDLGCLVRIPSEPKQSMIGLVVRYLDLLGDCITTRDCCGARPKSSPINPLTAAVGGRRKRITSEPVISIACLVRCTIRAITAILTVHIRTLQLAIQEAIFGSLFFFCRGKISGCQKEVHERLILTDSVSEHSAMIAVVVNAPLDFDYLVCSVTGDYGITPVVSRLVVVNTDSGVVPAGSTSTHLGFFQIWPCGYWFENGAFGASVDPSL